MASEVDAKKRDKFTQHVRYCLFRKKTLMKLPSLVQIELAHVRTRKFIIQ